MIHSTFLAFLHVPLIAMCSSTIYYIPFFFNSFQYLIQLHTILDEMILGGQVIETSSEQIVKSVEEIERFSPQPSPLPPYVVCTRCLMLIALSLT
jgi:hypothetical protein